MSKKFVFLNSSAEYEESYKFPDAPTSSNDGMIMSYNHTSGELEWKEVHDQLIWKQLVLHNSQLKLLTKLAV